MKLVKPGNKGGDNEPKGNVLGMIGSMLGGSLMSMFSPNSEKKDSALLWLALQADLKKVLQNKELFIQYQPIVNLQNDEIFGMEALVRWQHPRLGVISPIDLFPVAEATGLAVPIGAWVLQEACSQTSKWHQEKFKNTPLKLFINISITQLRDEHFLNTLSRVLKNTHLDPEWLVLELPQTAGLEKEDIAIFNRISDMGIGLCIDDFGTANSKWSLLKSFEIIKIDNAVIQMINDHEDNSAMIVSAIFAMATSLGLKTLAEGVETEEQYQFLKDKKCDFMQGFYFGKPLHSAEFTKLLIKEKNKS